jgi:pyruvate formate lyase activating enzyme
MPPMQCYNTGKVWQKGLNDRMARCSLCNAISNHISKELGVCLKCIREKPENALSIAMQAHRKVRIAFGLPERPPKDPQGLACNICVNECKIPEGRTGYCGVRRNVRGRLEGISPKEGKLSWYHDPLPTNCVGDWVCPGGTGSGYPEYAHSSGPEYGYKNLSVFFHACSFNCLYCQNWHFRDETLRSGTTSAEDLASAVDNKMSCICYFGGDPTPQLPFAIKASRLALERNKGRLLRICWETNGSMQKGLLDQMIELSLSSGGCIKFDLKAWDENLHMALTMISNKRTLENFSRVGERAKERPVPPLLVGSTLLVPGYIDEQEVRGIARFIASMNPDIPYSLLAYHPHFHMSDLPSTPRSLSEKCLKVAQEEGLKNVRIGNIHLLA